MSVFDIETGRMIQPPTLDDIPKYDVRVEGENIIVSISSEWVDHVVPHMTTQDQRDDRNFVIVGTGAAGMAAAETLRQAGFGGHITMISEDKEYPYDRTELSKRYLSMEKEPEVAVRSADFYETHGIQILRGKRLHNIDARRKQITLADKSALSYDTLLLATGGTPRSLNVPGEDMKNVFLLRSRESAGAIRAAINESKSAVIVGGGFIGMETAAGLRQRGLEVTLVTPEVTPLSKQFGDEIGSMYKRLHEQNGVKFITQNTVARFDGGAKLKSVVLANGEAIPADMAIIGIGVRLNTEFNGELPRAKDGSIVVDSRMRAAPSVFAAGDIATFPDWRTGRPIRIEHWRTAMQLGRNAALNMAGNDVEYEGLPFFWTFQYKVVVQYIGHAADWDEIVFDGNTDDMKFMAYYVKDGAVMAAAGCGRNYDMCRLAEFMRALKTPSLEEATHPTVEAASER